VSNIQSRHTSYEVDAHKSLAKRKDVRIAELEQKVTELTEQVSFFKNQRRSNLVVLQLEEELGEKKRTLQEVQDEAQAQISNLKERLNSQYSKLAEYRKLKFETTQLQTQLDEKNRQIRRLEEDNSRISRGLTSLVDDRKSAYRNLQDTMENMELENEQAISENAHLKDQNEASKEQIRALFSENEELRKNVGDLKEKLADREGEIVSKDRTIARLDDEIKQLKEILGERNQTIAAQGNEISVMRAEMSMMSQISPPVLSTEPSSVQPVERVDKEFHKLVSENSAIKVKMAMQEREIIELKNAIETLRIANSERDEANQMIQDQLQRTQASCDRRLSRVSGLKEEIESLQELLRQKEKLISELLAI
jgi:chromosome segregation ATPase